MEKRSPAYSAVCLAPTEARGKTISIIMGGVASGTVLGVPLGLLLAERWGWQAAMWLIALIGVVGLIDLFSGPRLTFVIMLLLGIALIALPLLLGISPWLALIPITLWGAVGWALQVPQNNELMKAREAQGDGNLAVALNESALYLGSALGVSLGGLALALQMPVDRLSIVAGLVALSGMGVQAWLWKQAHARSMACPDS